MKYIRTKDGIEPLYIDEFTEEGKEHYKNCKIADTIEELCDLYIENGFSISTTTSKYDLFSGEDGSWLKHIGLPQHQVEIYGAILVVGEKNEPILKSVAKMNEKGELELL